MAACGNPLSRSLLGVKQTCRFALQMSAYDPKRTFQSMPLITDAMRGAKKPPSRFQRSIASGCSLSNGVAVAYTGAAKPPNNSVPGLSSTCWQRMPT
jgi:hypothetical protein